MTFGAEHDEPDEGEEASPSGRGVPLTAAQLEELAELYAVSGNAAAVARHLGVAVSTVTRNLARLPVERRATLMQESLAQGLILGGETLRRAQQLAGALLFQEIAAGQAMSLDANGVRALITSVAASSTALAKLDEREDHRVQASLTRLKTQAETKAIAEKSGQLPPLDEIRAKLPATEMLRLLAMYSDAELDEAERALKRPRPRAPE